MLILIVVSNGRRCGSAAPPNFAHCVRLDLRHVIKLSFYYAIYSKFMARQGFVLYQKTVQNYSPTIAKEEIDMTVSNHTDLLKVDLQFFAEEEAILPDDFEGFEESTPEEPETVEETQEEEQELSQEDEQQTDGMTEQEKQAFLRIKYNKEEIELDEEKAKELAQKGMNYDKLQEKVQTMEQQQRESLQKARDEFIKEQGYQWNGKPITTEAEYKQALMEQQLMEKYKDKDLPKEVIDELLESRRFREESKKKEEEQQSKLKEAEQQKQQEQQYMEFLDYFKQVNGRQFDADKDQIPNEVWEQTKEGTPLLFAYMKHKNSELQNQLKVYQQNKENEEKAPVKGVTAHGSEEVASEDDFLKGFNSI